MRDRQEGPALTDEVAIVTGASSGIGREITLTFAQEGANVVLAARREAKLMEVAREVRNRGGESLVVPTDVSQEDQVVAMVGQALAQFGRVDVLVNNSGMGYWGPVVGFKAEDWDEVFDVNVKGTFLCSREVLPTMVEQRSGRIINISSDAGVIPFAESTAYCAAKAAVVAFSRCLALEMLPHDVGVHVICPGYVDTPWYDGDSSAPDRGKMLKAEDIARLALYLASLPPRVLIDQVMIQPRGMAME
ncbi:MAG: SDR family NAD(P)-dependent oxidoreductase [Anaerolineae bacterium]|nr:SDR family NAD(P)-dependent oxidoreductase [Anaerolineae bacterium]NIN95649.1 SDR family NAD(P)-dependent oxidoreductase [Anaerolineae bacterium]NIQ78604.1 SDR family NAD(P)-dependent oxidoreductase [Anaerolineae bacterium]